MFEKIIGNNKVKEYLNLSIQSQNIPHSYMFVGKAGISKKLFAREYAKRIMCINPNEECESCIKFETNSNPDYLEIIPEGKTLKIEQIRKMQERIAEKPIVSNKKVYIIDDADLMSEESQNCLLKTLEEPPEYAVIILIVANESKILATIKSRCVIVKFDKLTNSEIKSIEPNLTDEFIESLEGSLEHLEKADERQEQFKQLKNIVNTVQNGTLVELFNKSNLLYDTKDDIISMLEYLNLLFFEKRWTKCVEIVENTKRKILANNNYDMCIDYLLMHIWEDRHK